MQLSTWVQCLLVRGYADAKLCVQEGFKMRSKF